MAAETDRVSELFGDDMKSRRLLVSPEGLEIVTTLASRGERAVAFMIDVFFMFVAIMIIYLIAFWLFFSRSNAAITLTLALFIAFIIRNFYFMHFELAWQGRTPGKKICGLRVISRQGGELTSSAIIARNLTREVEFFLPLSLYLSLGTAGALQHVTLLGWVAAIGALPFFNRDRLRAGDMIAGTQVIVMPKRVLLPDLAVPARKATEEKRYTFSRNQLAIYGTFELQVLEEFLRRQPDEETDRLLGEVCKKITRKIGWEEDIPPGEIRNFLTDFYAAERGNLERNQLFGKFKRDKNDG